MLRKERNETKAVANNRKKTSTRSSKTARTGSNVRKAKKAVVEPEVLAPDITPTPEVKSAVVMPTLGDDLLAQAPQKPVPPVLKQVVNNAATTEKLAVIMGNNPRGIIRL